MKKQTKVLAFVCFFVKSYFDEVHSKALSQLHAYLYR